MDEADRVADRVAIIDHGELLVLDTPEALKGRVGQGDVLEIGLNGQAGNGDKVCAALASITGPGALTLSNGTLIVRALNVVSLLPIIVETLAAIDVECGEVRLRENSLEDVFIQLTGRRLRE